MKKNIENITCELCEKTLRPLRENFTQSLQSTRRERKEKN